MNEWISVKERLPEEGTLCVALSAGITDWGKEIREFYLADFKQGSFLYTEDIDYYGGLEIPEITHWIPVPSFSECDHEHLKEMKGMFDITEAKSHYRYVERLDGRRTYLNEFTMEVEKQRASKITEALQGMTIREAQDFLQRVSDALTGVVIL